MLLSVISRAHRGRKIGQRNISLLGHWWPEIRVAPRSSRRGRPGPAAVAALARGPGGSRRAGSSRGRGTGRPGRSRVRRLDPDGALTAPFTHPAKWITNGAYRSRITVTGYSAAFSLRPERYPAGKA
jgi:hypothetical protein